MRITKFHADKLHDHLTIDIDFFDDLTIITGLNGCGKTTALKLIMALVSPDIDVLGSISFAFARVEFYNDDTFGYVQAEKDPNGISIKTSLFDEIFYVSSSDLELFIEAKRRSEPSSPILDKIRSNSVFLAIASLYTPMFLGIDRRFSAPPLTLDENVELRRRDYMARRLWHEEHSGRNVSTAASLREVNLLAAMKMQEIRSEQEQLDERLRAQFFMKAFEYKSNFINKPSKMPSRSELEGYRNQLKNIERAAEGMKIPVPEIELTLNDFFERMGHIIDTLEQISSNGKKKSSKKSSKLSEQETANLFAEWIIHRPQADKILELLNILDEYTHDRDALREPINKFVSIVNGFLSQTGKQLIVKNKGNLKVKIDSCKDERDINALSSGEIQILVMMAHLLLNPTWSGSGIFIVDEPEISLHIDWQEKFVDAVLEANPSVQLILATHSPAIILDRTEACQSLSKVNYA